MATSRGKQFEKIVQRDLNKVDNLLCERLHDITSGYVNLNTPSDYIVYKNPNIYYLECKSIHGPSIPINNLIQLDRINTRIKDIYGAYGKFLIWFIDYKETFIVDATLLNDYINREEYLIPYLDKEFKKSINRKEFNDMCSNKVDGISLIPAQYKRIFPKFNFNNVF